MSERYKKLYHLPHRLYTSHAPVLIESGSLLLERRTNAMLCQLCFRNIQDKPVKSLRAVVQMLDAQGNPLGNPVDHRYLDLDLKREEDCGRGVAIVLPSLQAAAFNVRVSQVSFADGEVWTDGNSLWEALPDQFTLEDSFVSMDELNRFLRRFGQDCSFAPVETDELWFCTCGAVNPNTEGRCHRCHRRRNALLGKSTDSLSPEELEEASFHSHAEEPVNHRRRRLGLLIGSAAVLVMLVLTGLYYLPRLKDLTQKATIQKSQEVTAAVLPDPAAPSPKLSRNEKQDAYQKALTLQVKAGSSVPEEAEALYEDAAESFEALGDYEDCPERAAECRAWLEKRRESLLRADYENASGLLAQGRYAEARELFLALGDYEDSSEQAKEAVYRKALALYQFVDEHDVTGVTASLRADAGEESLVALPREELLRLGSAGLKSMEACFGGDPVRFIPSDPESEELEPLQLALADLLSPLGAYRDSEAMAAQLPEMMDRSEEFFTLCQAGQLEEARAWLEAWDKPFEDRELWAARLQRFLPFCRDWELLTGDPSLPSALLGEAEKIYSLRCSVSLTRDGAVLLLLLHEGDETGPELYADLEDESFLLHRAPFSYLVYISRGDSLCVVRLNEGIADGGVEYVRG